MRVFFRMASVAFISLLTVIAAAGSVQAQTPADPLPVQPQTDANGIDLVNRTLLLTGLGGVSIGQPGAGGLSFSRVYFEGGWRHSALSSISSSGSTYTVSAGGGAESFTKSGSAFTSDQGTGSELIYEEDCWFDTELQETICAYKRYTYTDRYGAVYSFDKLLVAGGAVGWGTINEGILTKATMPDGEVINYNYNSVTLSGSLVGSRLQSITNNLGYQIHLYYARDTVTTGTHLADWRRITKATAFNTDVDTCNPLANNCTFSRTWPKVDYTGTLYYVVDSATDTLGRVTTFTHNTSQQLTGIKLPGSSANDVSYTYASGATVSAVTSAGVTHNYAASDSAGVRTVTVSGPLSTQSVVKSSLTTGRITSSKNGENEVTEYEYDTKNRVTKIIAPEDNFVLYTYDARGNVTETEIGDKAGLPNLTNFKTYAGFPACTAGNKKICNKPSTTTDLYGKVTNYTYSTTHGGMLTVKAPLGDGGARQQVTTTYASYISGAVWRPTTVTTCATATTCAGTANETKTQYAHSGPHLEVANIKNGDGSGGLLAQTTFTYNDYGDVKTADGPMSGTGDTIYYFYDGLRRSRGTISPLSELTPSSSLRRAERITYTTRGLVDTVERGTTTSTTSVSAITVLLTNDTNYDGHGRPIEAKGSTSAGVQSLTQWSYDAAGRLDCTAVRLNLSPGATVPCTATTSSFGSDRVSRNHYDNASRVVRVRAGVNTSEARDTVTTTYTDNGRIATVEDGEGNVTAYTYDDHDRLVETTFPDLSTEELTYYAGWRVKTLTQRDTSEIEFTYDDRGQVTLKNVPGTFSDATYSYDVMGRQTKAEIGATNRDVSTVYDALGRVTSTTANNETVSYQYDLASRRTRMTWPDAFYVTYDYDDAGVLTAIRENGSTALVSFEYNGLGQRTKLVRDNGADTTYAYDDALLLDDLDHDFTGAADDLEIDFDYNPVGQITMRETSNTAYDYSGFASVTIASVNNAMNQTTSVGGVSTTHDDRGNMTDDGTHAYSYDKQNRLVGRGVGEVLRYDAAMRLWQVEDGAARRRFLYDGSEIIAEMTNANVIEKRYVRGPGADEVLVEYDTTGVSDVRTWLYADERGSIIAGADDSGNRTFVNTYDEFGKPASGNTGNFQYTGQLWVEEVELYHYKARAYNPEIGRFMQTDPIGYGDGLNMYNYVGSDPVNGRDPSGLLEESEAINHDIPINPNDDGCLTPDCIVVTGTRIDYGGGGALAAWSSGSGNNVIQVTTLENASIGNPTTSDAGLRSDGNNSPSSGSAAGGVTAFPPGQGQKACQLAFVFAGPGSQAELDLCLGWSAAFDSVRRTPTAAPIVAGVVIPFPDGGHVTLNGTTNAGTYYSPDVDPYFPPGFAIRVPKA